MEKFLNSASLILLSLVFISFSSDNLEKGTASYYGKSFEGRRTASGEILRNDSLTAAHKTLKFGTIVKVTNLKNDSVVVVKINDRLPKSSTRVIDLTLGAAKQLNFIKAGLTPVTIAGADHILRWGRLQQDLLSNTMKPKQQIYTQTDVVRVMLFKLAKNIRPSNGSVSCPKWHKKQNWMPRKKP